jgi:hypothetical protein
MTSRSPETSPQTYARVGGALYLFIIVAALFAEAFVRGTLIVPHDPDATAGKILGSELLFRTGLAGEMLTCVCDVAMAWILYVLLRPVSRNLALLGAFFRLTFVAVYSVAKLFEVAALATLDGAGDLKAFGPQQLHDLAYVSLRVHSLGYGVSLLFFGFCCAVFGDLIYRSGFLPRTLGVLLMIGGVCYVSFSLAQMLDPAFAARYLFPWLMLPAFPAELGLALWLTVKGVDVPRWRERTQAARLMV